jgi:hypothetical protein
MISKTWYRVRYRIAGGMTEAVQTYHVRYEQRPELHGNLRLPDLFHIEARARERSNEQFGAYTIPVHPPKACTQIVATRLGQWGPGESHPFAVTGEFTGCMCIVFEDSDRNVYIAHIKPGKWGANQMLLNGADFFNALFAPAPPAGTAGTGGATVPTFSFLKRDPQPPLTEENNRLTLRDVRAVLSADMISHAPRIERMGDVELWHGTYLQEGQQKATLLASKQAGYWGVYYQTCWGNLLDAARVDQLVDHVRLFKQRDRFRHT